MFKQRLLAIALVLITALMVVVSSDATIALLTIPMALMMLFKKFEEEVIDG